MLRVEKLKVHGLEPVSFHVSGGECVAVEGPSGSGKTVLLRAIADLDPAEGLVTLGDKSRGDMTGPAWRKRVRYLSAEPGWWAETPRPHFEKTAGLGKALAELGLTSGHLDRSISELSTGERQRLALLRAIGDRPDILLLDEPTGALDARATASAEKMLKALKRSGVAIILVSHDPSQVKRLCERAFAIRGGKFTGVRR